ncbi:RNA polymerase sigma factor RpoE [Dehalobacter sp. UNSWDHB]|nr:RNA polymerase sigma factor RpoE [Dehalobacter sp. DCA]AFV06476.1 RNA polymerase sigma factor RpoE [Dehalobacter sp. CF]EQB22161.1 RNA polymerase sigma factor RpoE [Dehalobacter sp. UNSWDHB]
MDSHDIDDIIMESLKRSIEKLERYDGSSEFASWVIGIAKFVIMEQLRKKTKNTLLEDMPDAEFDHIISLFSVDPLFVILNKEIHDAIIAAINQLSPEHQQIIQLRLFNKVSFEQISEISKKSESAIYSLYSRALKSLRKILKEKL